MSFLNYDRVNATVAAFLKSSKHHGKRYTVLVFPPKFSNEHILWND